jgi:hypothetical protein
MLAAAFRERRGRTRSDKSFPRSQPPRRMRRRDAARTAARPRYIAAATRALPRRYQLKRRIAMLGLRFGYPCQNLTINASTNHTLRLASLQDNEKLSRVILQNFYDLERMLYWNHANEWFLLRIGQHLIPFASHPDFPYDWVREHGAELQRLGELAKRLGIRLSMHPSQVVNPASPSPEVCRTITGRAAIRRHRATSAERRRRCAGFASRRHLRRPQCDGKSFYQRAERRKGNLEVSGTRKRRAPLDGGGCAPRCRAVRRAGHRRHASSHPEPRRMVAAKGIGRSYTDLEGSPPRGSPFKSGPHETPWRPCFLYPSR